MSSSGEQLVYSPGTTILEETRAAAQNVNDFIYQQPETVGVLGDKDILHDRDGLYISPWIVPEAKEVALPVLTEIQLLPGLQLGAGDTTHKVVFGNVVIRVEGANDLVPVAVKPFIGDQYGGIGKAIHEHTCLMHARALGFDTFRPLAIAKDGDKAYLITQRRDEINSFDNEDWTISPSDTDAYNAYVAPNLRFLAQNTALMHAKGFFHGDAQAKNFAVTDTGGFVLIDLEDAKMAKNSSELITMLNGSGDIRDSLALQDIKQFWFTLTHPVGTVSTNIFLTEETAETCIDEFTNRYLDPYLEALHDVLDPDVRAAVDFEALREAAIEQVRRTS